MANEVAHKPSSGRWTYTTASPKFVGHTNKVRAFSGSIHAGWEDAPEFETSDAFYDWAKAECARRNILEAAAPDLLREAQELVAFFEQTGFSSAFLDGLRAAIVKATTN